MATAYNRKKQPELVRRTLLDCAAKLALEQGLAAVTVQAVSHAAGVTKGRCSTTSQASRRWSRASSPTSSRSLTQISTPPWRRILVRTGGTRGLTSTSPCTTR